MALGIGGAGILGVSFEAVYGTYVAPDKFIPVRSESLTHTEDKQFLSPIRGLASPSYVKRGYTREEGDIQFEVTSDILIYFLYAARTTPSRVGASAPYTYTFIPASVVQPTTEATASTRKTLSIYILRAGEVFAYTGCTVTSLSFTIDNGDLICTAHVMGLAIDVTKGVTASAYDAWVPFGPGDIGIELPSATERIDIDTFTIEINDNGEALNRVQGGGERGPSYVRWGERGVTGSFEHDFLDLSEFTAFDSNTSRVMIITASHSAVNDQVKLTLNNLYTTTYPVNLPGLGDLVRASVDLTAMGGGSSQYEFEIITNEAATV